MPDNETSYTTSATNPIFNSEPVPLSYGPLYESSSTGETNPEASRNSNMNYLFDAPNTSILFLVKEVQKDTKLKITQLCQESTNLKGHHSADALCTKGLSKDQLYEELQNSKAKIVIPLDNFSAAFFEMSPIHKHRGTLKKLKSLYVMPMMLLSKATPLSYGYAKFDWFTVLQILEGTTFFLSYELNVKPVLADVEALFSRLRPRPHAFDIETEGDELCCISFCGVENFAMCVPFVTATGHYWSKREEPLVRRMIKDFLEDEDIWKIAHNAPYDVGWLKKYAGIEVKSYYDSMAMWHCFEPEMPKNLGFCSSIFSHTPYHKDLYRKKNVSDTDFWTYCALDSLVCWRTYRGLWASGMMRKLGYATSDIEVSHLDIVQPLLPILVEMEERGVRIDEEKRKQAVDHISNEVENQQFFLNEVAGGRLNVNSSKQVAAFLYDRLKIAKRYKDGRLTTESLKLEDAFRQEEDSTKAAALQAVIKLRKNKKLLSTYLKVPISDDGRIRCSFNIAGTRTGRLSSSKSIIYRSGTNLQNIPKGVVRETFIPSDGYTFISADLAQAEVRVVAYLANESFLIDCIEARKSIHLVVGEALFGHPIKKGTKEYDIAKASVHAFNYGMGKISAGRLMQVPASTARGIIEKLRDLLPNVVRWQRDTLYVAKCLRRLKTPMNRWRNFYTQNDNKLMREACSYLGQSTIADFLNESLIRVVANRGSLDIRPLLNEHDGVIFEVPTDTYGECMKVIHDAFDKSIYINPHKVYIPAVFTKGRNWNVL